MNRARTLQQLYRAPWNITREGWLALALDLRDYLSGEKEIPQNADPETDLFGQPLPKMEIEDGQAIIPIQGALLNHASWIEKKLGYVSYDDIKRDIREAVGAGVDRIVLHVDSPGGMAQGSEECGMAIDEARSLVRVDAVTDGMMCSAAYGICCGAHKIYATRSADVGSIGTYLALLDSSDFYAQVGLKVEMFKSDELKGIGMPGLPLTDAQKKHLQAEVDECATIFKNRVTSCRPVTDPETMRGQSMRGDKAQAAGLVDTIIRDVREIL